MAAKPGLKAVDLFRAVGDGRIKALWIMATNPVVSMPDAGAIEAALKACPFVVVSDVLKHTDTTRYAHVLLPSLGWGEKDGTVTNSERRISRQRPFLDAPGEARADWWQLSEVARRMGHVDAFSFGSPSEIFAEHAALSSFENEGARDFDIGAFAAIDTADYDALAPVQWPQTGNGKGGNARFFADSGFYHADRRARFVPVSPVLTDRREPKYPFTLNTGRIRDQWHTMTRTGRSARLSSHMAEPFAEINPLDAGDLGITDADLVEIDSPLGSVIVRALLTNRQARSNIFVPMHWNNQFSGKARIDMLVPPITDRISGQPASKNVGVSIRKYSAALYGYMISAFKPVELTEPYWALARTKGGWRTELAFDDPALDLADWVRRTCGISMDIDPLGYRDSLTGEARIAFFEGSKLLAAVFVAREPVQVARNWAASQLEATHDNVRKRYQFVAGRPGADKPDPGATVCSCFGVGVNQIVAAARAGADTVDAIGKALGAGTNCGSCRAEIRGIIDSCALRTAAE